MHVAIRVAENWIVAIAFLMLGSRRYGRGGAAQPRNSGVPALHETTPPLAGLVAAQLARWNYWNAVPEYTALLQSGALQDSAMRSLDTCRAAAMRSLNICRAAQVRTSRSHPERLQ